MFFKIKMKAKMGGLLIVSCNAALSLVGCSDFLNGESAKPEVIEFSDTRFTCLKEVPAQLKNLSIGEAHEGEIRAGFDCLTQALTYFQKRTFGSAENGGYKVEEMRRFFGKYFLKENNVTEDFAADLMKIKKALLGGSTTHLSKMEISQLIELLQVTRDELVRLAPHIKLLLKRDSTQKPSWEEVSVATEKLRVSLQRLLTNTQITQSDYSFEDGKKALIGFAQFIKGDQLFAPYERYSEWVPLLEAVKNALVGKRAQFSNTQQWIDSLNTFVKLYDLVLKYQYNLKDFTFDNSAKVQRLTDFIGQGLSLISESHQMKTTGRIPSADLDYLIEQALPRLPFSVTAKSVQKTYRVILLKILDPDRKLDARSFVGLEKKHLLSLAREVSIWRLQQNFIDSLDYSTPSKGFTQAEINELYKAFDATKVIPQITEEFFEQAALQKSWLDLAELLAGAVPVMFNAQGRMVIDVYGPLKPQTWSSLTKANLMRALSRTLLLGYGKTSQERISQVRMDKAGLISWYDDFQDVFLEIGAFDPRSANSGSRSFLEANFFTFSGNGDDLMDHKESFEFVSTLFAAGLSTSKNIMSAMAAEPACVTPEKDVFGHFFLKGTCFSAKLKEDFGLYFDNLPGMSRAVSEMDAAEWEEFFNGLMSVSLTSTQIEEEKRAREAAEPLPKLMVETANIRTMVTILHYVETLLVLYDKDHNNGLNLQEVYAAAPRFIPFFKNVTGTTNETLLTEGFAHLVFRGSIPGATDLARFQLSKITGLGEAHRSDIVRIFATLKEQLNKTEN